MAKLKAKEEKEREREAKREARKKAQQAKNQDAVKVKKEKEVERKKSSDAQKKIKEKMGAFAERWPNDCNNDPDWKRDCVARFGTEETQKARDPRTNKPVIDNAERPKPEQQDNSRSDESKETIDNMVAGGNDLAAKMIQASAKAHSPGEPIRAAVRRPPGAGDAKKRSAV